MTYNDLILEFDADVAVLMLDRPDKLNSLKRHRHRADPRRAWPACPRQLDRGGLYRQPADVYQVEALTQILSGSAGGTTALLSILVGRRPGVVQEKVSYEIDSNVRRFTIPKIIDGELHTFTGPEKGKPTTIENSSYWIGPVITVVESIKSRFRGFGRNWNFRGKSAEIVPLDWQGP